MTKTILVTGASGLIGQKLIKELLLHGAAIVAVTRNIAKAKQQLPFPIEFVLWSLLDYRILQKIDGIFHLAGENIAESRWSKKQKDKIYNSRIITTKKLVSLCSQRAKELDFFCSASAIGYYASGNDCKSEESPAGKGFLSRLCQDWEYEAKKVKAKRNIIVRLGVVLDANGGALQKMLPLFRLGIAGRIGFQKIWMSWITSADVVHFFLQALQKKQYQGIYNLVTPEPITNAQLTKKLAKIYRLPALFLVPRWVIRLVFGEMSQIILASQKVYPKKLLQEKHSFCHPTIDKALLESCSILQTRKKKEAHFCFQNYQFLPFSEKKVFSFFSNPYNLFTITPDFLDFQILQCSSKEIKKNTLITYKLKIYKIPIRWKTIIKDFKPYKYFSDSQIQGPYLVWFHQHFFHPINVSGKQGVLLEDKVFYKLRFMPFSLFGLIVIKKDLQKIFAYRNQATKKIFFLN